jgi:hypothetical protein
MAHTCPLMMALRFSGCGGSESHSLSPNVTRSLRAKMQPSCRELSRPGSGGWLLVLTSAMPIFATDALQQLFFGERVALDGKPFVEPP